VEIEFGSSIVHLVWQRSSRRSSARPFLQASAVWDILLGKDWRCLDLGRARPICIISPSNPFRQPEWLVQQDLLGRYRLCLPGDSGLFPNKWLCLLGGRHRRRRYIWHGRKPEQSESSVWFVGRRECKIRFLSLVDDHLGYVWSAVAGLVVRYCFGNDHVGLQAPFRVPSARPRTVQLRRLAHGWNFSGPSCRFPLETTYSKHRRGRREKERGSGLQPEPNKQFNQAVAIPFVSTDSSVQCF